MHSFSIFCAFLLQVILFIQPIVSQGDQDRIREVLMREGLIPEDGNFKLEYTVTRPAKQCSKITYPLGSIFFLITPCYDKSTKELDVNLKAGDMVLGQAKGTFDSGVSISFDHGQLLKGKHHYYLKENGLWLEYSGIMFGKKYKEDVKLGPVPRGIISSGDKPNRNPPKPKPEL